MMNQTVDNAIGGHELTAMGEADTREDSDGAHRPPAKSSPTSGPQMLSLECGIINFKNSPFWTLHAPKQKPFISYKKECGCIVELMSQKDALGHKIPAGATIIGGYVMDGEMP